MSIVNRAMALTDYLITVFQGIDQGSNYNNTVKHMYIKKGGYLPEDFDNYPAICIPAIDLPETVQGDQIIWNSSVKIDVIGYVKNEDNAFEEAEKLAADIQRAIEIDESFGGLVWSLSLTVEIGSFREIGEVVISINAMTEYSKPS